MRPTLRIGSMGPYVFEAQTLLNSRNPTAMSRLAPDGAFGPMTRSRVVEYQRMQMLMVDGIIGQQTWDSLVGGTSGSPSSGGGSSAPPLPGPGSTPGQPPAPVPGQQGAPNPGSAPTPGVSPGSEEGARNKIREIALTEFANYRWNSGDSVSTGNPRIAGKLCADSASRARQGGQHLCEIFQIGGAPNPTKCLTISQAAVAMYQRSYTPAERNNTDIPSWCGIFTLYCLKMAGLKLSGWPFKYNAFGQPRPGDEMRVKLPTAPPKVGDVGIVDPIGGSNHHFLIVEVNGNTIKSVDGNAGMLMEIVSKTYTLSEVAQRRGYFIEPLWERVL